MRARPIAMLIALTAAGLAATGGVPAQDARAFPEAVGFGTETPAGRGGEVIRVTTLAAEGAGSLREALEASGPRIVVFEVGGVIDLNRTSLGIHEPFITVAGQTAPSPGITITRGSLYISTHDILIQHIRVRPGDAGLPKRDGWEPDGISTSGGAYSVVIDHCSISWAVDENLTASGPRLEGPEATSHDITFSNCIIAEGLCDSTHRKGPHSMGSLIHDFCRNISIVGNLYAHNNARNPYFKAHTTGVVVNNVIQNPGVAAVQIGFPDREWANSELTPANGRIGVVGNVLLHGPDTRPGLPMVASRGDVYMDDNIATGAEGEPAPLVGDGIVSLDECPVWPEGLEVIPADRALEHVATHAGARPRDRDAVDARIVQQLQDGTGRLIDSQEEVGGYPVGPMTRRELDIPDGDLTEWLAEMATAVE